MALPQLKYNPGVHGDQELVDGFVVRHHNLELILEVIRENTDASNQHLLIVGPRGSGKTTLVRRVAAEIRRDPDLEAAWYPIVFAEESYLISSPGEFWLETLFHLGEQTRDERWDRAYQELRQELDEDRLRQRALAQLMDFATESGRRVLLIVENMNMLLGEQMKGTGDWDLRHTLLNEPRVMLLGTATSRFEGIERIDQAWFELLAIQELQSLDAEECSALWGAITGEEPRATRLRPIQILTGGNPRLLRILAEFAAGRSFRELMSQLVHLIDEHTEYFKSHLDNLAAQERKVFVSLLELWDPVSAREVAQVARLGVSKTSSLLSRLVSRGAVQLVDQRGRRKFYQASERLFNIYYLMRRRSHPSSRVRAVVAFMVQFYEEDQLIGATRELAREACSLQPTKRLDHYLAYIEIIKYLPNPKCLLEIFRQTPRSFFELGTPPADSLQLEAEPENTDDTDTKIRAGYWIARGHLLSEEPDRLSEAEQAYRRALEIDSDAAIAWALLAQLLQSGLERYEEAEYAYQRALALEPDDEKSWFGLGWLLHWHLKRHEEAEAAYRKAIQLKSGKESWHLYGALGLLLHEKMHSYSAAEQAYRKSIGLRPENLNWTCLGKLLHEEFGRHDEAEDAYRKANRLQSSYFTWMLLGRLLGENLCRHAEAEEALRAAIKLNSEYAPAWMLLGLLLQAQGRDEEAEAACRKAIGIQSDTPQAWVLLGQLLQAQGRDEEAEAACRKAIEVQPDYAEAWATLGKLLHTSLDQYDEAEEAYRRAIAIQRDSSWAWAHLGLLLADELGRYEEAEGAYRKAIGLRPDYSWAWGCLGQLLHEKLKRYDEAEVACRKAVEINPESSWACGQLASIWTTLRRWRDVIEIIPPFLDDAADYDEVVDVSTRIFTDLAAAGFAEEALQKLLNSKGAEALEPLAVGLQIFLGHDPKKAQEILEIGKDVAERIRHRQAQLAERKPSRHVRHLLTEQEST